MKEIANMTIEERLTEIKDLLNHVNTSNKLAFLNNRDEVNNFIDKNPILKRFISSASKEEVLVIKSVLAIGEGPTLFSELQEINEPLEWLHVLAQILIPVEKFYSQFGGIIGYHVQFLQLLITKKEKKAPVAPTIHYLKPEGLHIEKENSMVASAIRWGLESLPKTIEIYPVGGAGERLGLRSEETQEALPVARLILGGFNLLEWLMRDLQAKEYLYFKLFGKQLVTPIAMMTSLEKNNHFHILNICEEQQWWGRPQNMFHLFMQPLVPVITEEGHWAMNSPSELSMKPGGHGVIWKLAHNEKVLEWAQKLHRDVALIRQINNPIAGTDYGLLAFMGIGWHEKKAFGFASCPRVLGTAQGMNVLIERHSQDGYEYAITNVEYTEFEEKGIQDGPEEPGSSFSKFPANTNILFAKLDEIKKAIDSCPFPGMIINMKSKVSLRDPETGGFKELRAGRLETMMQNIADVLIDKSSSSIDKSKYKDLKTFVIYNDRRKTISVAKRAYDYEKPLLETPEGCFYEVLQNARDLLVHDCGMQVPEIGSEEDYLDKGPVIYITYNPILGPLYSVIRQKISGGSLTEGSSLQLEIAELEMRNLSLQGSLQIRASNPYGQRDDKGLIVYGDGGGKCELINVTIKNAGINKTLSSQIWKDPPIHQEAVTIILHGNAEFYAENVTFLKDHHIEVEEGQRMTATMSKDGAIEYRVERIAKPTWKWGYSFGPDNQVFIKKIIC